MSPTRAGPPVRRGMPFRKWYEMRDQVRHAMDELSHLQTTFTDAQQNPNCTQVQLEHHREALRFKSAELVALQKQLRPMEANFEKAQAGKRKRTTRSPLEPQPKRKKRDDRPKETKEVSPKIAPAVQRLLLNTATLDVALPPAGCHLSANECQYRHLERLRHQYARPFELFCGEMDTISDTCLTGICLALPDMPWSVALSRLAFLFKPMLDSHDSHSASSDTNHLSAGTTIGCEQHIRYIRLAEVMIIQDWRDFMRTCALSQLIACKLIHNEDVGLIFPFKKSYGRIFVDKWEGDSFVRIDTQLQIPPMYTSEEVRPILEKLPTWTEVCFNVILSSLFWHARKCSMPFLNEIERRTWGSTSFDHRSPRYQCPFCHGFDNFSQLDSSLLGTIVDYADFIQALRHMLFAHTRVPPTRKAKFLLEEVRVCLSIDDAWKTILREKYDASMASLKTGVIPQAIADLSISNRSMVNKGEECVATRVEVRDEKECAENQCMTESKAES
ncbi:hypothetical protein F5B21DRAFT_514856 [Xylaria acuta]|nr:hypothetical protein F5B21DRAFT_514856 [Xylaria acuta]